MKKVKVEEAVGMVLGHDVTEIVPEKKKGVAFSRGRVIEKGDVEKLLDLGKAHVYVEEPGEPEIHEDEAARRLGLALADDHMDFAPPKEGRINLVSRVDGLFTVNRASLERMNEVQDVLVTVIPDGYPVRTGDVVAATRIVPLSIREPLLQRAEAIAKKGLIRVHPYKAAKTGLVVTGSEVYTGRIQDGSGLVVEKLEGYGLEVIGRTLVPDDIGMIREAILALFSRGAELVITTGGLSVDPDDVTKEGIEATGAKLILYGAPVFPGAMFALARLGKRYIVGAPACVYYSRYTILDLVLPRLMAGLNVTARTIRRLAHGGLCLNCPQCRYPNCFFGKGA